MLRQQSIAKIGTADYYSKILNFV